MLVVMEAVTLGRACEGKGWPTVEGDDFSHGG